VWLCSSLFFATDFSICTKKKGKKKEIDLRNLIEIQITGCKVQPLLSAEALSLETESARGCLLADSPIAYLSLPSRSATLVVTLNLVNPVPSSQKTHIALSFG